MQCCMPSSSHRGVVIGPLPAIVCERAPVSAIDCGRGLVLGADSLLSICLLYLRYFLTRLKELKGKGRRKAMASNGQPRFPFGEKEALGRSRDSLLSLLVVVMSKPDILLLAHIYCALINHGFVHSRRCPGEVLRFELRNDFSFSFASLLNVLDQDLVAC